MGLLDHLWDETVAGPRPDSGLGKLRKYNSFSPSTSSPAADAAAASAAAGDLAVTRSITVIRQHSFSPRAFSSGSGSAPSSPASLPDSPFGHAPETPRGEWKSLRRKPKPKPMAEEMETAEPRRPTVYDWVVISSLDR